VFTLGPGFGGIPCCQDELGPAGAGPTDPVDGFGPVDGKLWPLALWADLRVPARAEFTPVSGIADNNAKLAKIKIVPALMRAVIKEEEFFFIKRMKVPSVIPRFADKSMVTHSLRSGKRNWM
jgi:hypothetical protein